MACRELASVLRLLAAVVMRKWLTCSVSLLLMGLDLWWKRCWCSSVLDGQLKASVRRTGYLRLWLMWFEAVGRVKIT